MYIDEKNRVQKNTKNNIAINLSKAKKKKIKINVLKAQLHHLNNHSFNVTHLDLATQMK